MRVPLPPKWEDLWAIGYVKGIGRLVPTKRQFIYRAALAQMFRARPYPFGGDVSLRMVVHFATDEEQLDATSRGRAVEHALQGLAFVNDWRVVDLRVTRGEPVLAPQRPYVDVTIEPWSSAAVKELLEELKAMNREMGMLLGPKP